ncbi:MAG: c-type cytochrome [Pseudomonadota bacterium]
MGSVAVAEEAERERIMAEIDKRLGDEAAREEALRAGRERAVLCANCHGADGNSVRPAIPNLAEQNTAYIIEQIGKFVEGQREHFVMPVLARDFSFQDKVNLAVYYTSQELEPGEGEPTLAAKGKSLYESRCMGCHGPAGRGEAGYALIAGQQVDYAVTTLKRFRDSASDAEGSVDAKRTDVIMEQAAAGLTDEEIEALAHYSALLH